MVIVLAGAILRLDHAASLMRFTGDEARDLRQAQGVTTRHEWPLLGPRIYRGQGCLGPFYAYLMALPLHMAHGNPAASVIVVAFFDTLAIILMYLLGRQIADRWTGMLAAMLYAMSFTMIFYARWGWHPSLLPFFTLLAIYSMVRIVHGSPTFLPLLALTLAILLQLHMSTVLLFNPAALAVRTGRRSFRWHTLVFTFCAGALPLLPLIIHELSSGFANTRAMIGMGTVMTASSHASFGRFLADIAQVVADQACWRYGHRAILLDQADWIYVLNILLVIAGLVAVVRQWRRDRQVTVLLLLWILLPPLALLRFGGARSHYYMLLWFPAALIAVAMALREALRHRQARSIVVALLFLLAVTNMASYAAYRVDLQSPRYDTFLAGPLGLKKAAVDAVIQHAGRRHYDLVIASWHWANHWPYLYLLSNHQERPVNVRVVVVSPDGGPAEVTEENPGAYFSPTVDDHTTQTLVILEPSDLLRLPRNTLVADLGQLQVHRVPGGLDNLPAPLMPQRTEP